jgi:hypothetical protein
VWRALRNAAGGVTLAAGLLLTGASEAAEFGFSDYFLGFGIPKSGYLPPPGAYFANSFLLYQGEMPSFNSKLTVDLTQLGYFVDTELFGATVGFVAIIPFIGDRNSFPLRLTDSSGISRAYRTIGEIAGLGDTDYSAVIGWHEGGHNWSFGLTGFAPTGIFIPHGRASTGLNRPAIDIKGAYTFLDLQTGAEISGALGLTFNARNKATKYQSGEELHIEWALNQHFPVGLAAGIGGYFYQQEGLWFWGHDRIEYRPFRGESGRCFPMR